VKDAPQYVLWPTVKAALPACVEWEESDLIAIGRQANTRLAFVRSGNNRSEAMWEVEAVIAWFAHTYRKAPGLAVEFENNLRSKAVT
jgi:hypothetical protein